MAEPISLGDTVWRCPVCNKVTEPYTEEGDTYSYCKEHKPKKAGFFEHWFTKKKEPPCETCKTMFGDDSENGKDYHLHKAPEECVGGCKAPHDHHEYKPVKEASAEEIADAIKQAGQNIWEKDIQHRVKEHPEASSESQLNYFKQEMPSVESVGRMSHGSALRVATNFILSKKQEFNPGDKVKVIEPRYQPLGIYEKTGEVTESLGRGWYMVKLEDGRLYRFFSGEGWSDIELIQSPQEAPMEEPPAQEQAPPEPEQTAPPEQQAPPEKTEISVPEATPPQEEGALVQP